MRLLNPIDTSSAAPVAVVIRARDEARFLGECLESLQRQVGIDAAEVLVIDSGSVDRTVDIARSFGVGVIEIPSSAFTYSSALNLGFERVSAPLVVSLSAHVTAIDASWLERLLAPFARPDVAATFSREMPRPDADFHERWRLAQIFPPHRIERSRALATEDEGDRQDLFTFSNAAGAVRRDLWRAHPFVELPYCEDLEWARWAIHSGLTTVQVPDARVLHSHTEPLAARSDREILSYLAVTRIFGRRLRRFRAVLGQLRPNLDLALGALVAPLPLLERLYWVGYAGAKWLRFGLRILLFRVSAPAPRSRNSAESTTESTRRALPTVSSPE